MPQDRTLMADESPEQVQIPVVWVGVDDMPVLMSNEAVVQHAGPDEFLLTFGLLTPPLLRGTPEEQAEQARSLGYVAIRPVARIGLTRQRLEAVLQVLQENLRKHDERFGKRVGGASEGA
jgi:hypothetical protein